MMPKELHGVKPCLLDKGNMARAPKKATVTKEQACFSKRRGEGGVDRHKPIITA